MSVIEKCLPIKIEIYYLKASVSYLYFIIPSPIFSREFGLYLSVTNRLFKLSHNVATIIYLHVQHDNNLPELSIINSKLKTKVPEFFCLIKRCVVPCYIKIGNRLVY